MNTVAIVDYGVSNLDSVARAVQECGGQPVVARGPADLEAAARIILPGVGTFAEGMRRLRDRGFDSALQEQATMRQIPLLGICLGMQLLATLGHEGGTTPGLGLIEGEVVRLEPRGPADRIPHVGWNEAHFESPSVPQFFRGLANGRDFYFVHSWHLKCRRLEDVLARTPYCGSFVSAVGRGSVFGVQFHPEKSQKAGFQVLRNFLSF